MRKHIFSMTAILASLWVGSAQAQFCISDVSQIELPKLIGDRPGKVTIRDGRIAFWKTTDRVLLSIEAGFFNIKPEAKAIINTNDPGKDSLKKLCHKRAEKCSVTKGFDDQFLVVEDSYQHMGSLIHRMKIFDTEKALILRGIAPPKHLDWLKRGMSESAQTVGKQLSPPC